MSVSSRQTMCYTDKIEPKKRRDSRNLLAITTIRVFNGTFQRDKSKAITEYNKKYPHVCFFFNFFLTSSIFPLLVKFMRNTGERIRE